MKLFLASVAVVFVSGCAAVAAGDPVGRPTPNGGFEYFSNHHPNQGLPATGCILPWKYYGFPVMGYNPKRINIGEETHFVDCKIPEARRVVVEPAPAPVVVPAPAPYPAPAPAEPEPEPQPAPVRE